MALTTTITRSSPWIYSHAWDLFIALVKTWDPSVSDLQEVRVPASTITNLLPATGRQLLEDIAYTNVVHRVSWTDPNDTHEEPSWIIRPLFDFIEYNPKTHCFVASFKPWTTECLISLKGILEALWKEGRPTKSMVQERFTSLYAGTKLSITSAPIKRRPGRFHTA